MTENSIVTLLPVHLTAATETGIAQKLPDFTSSRFLQQLLASCHTVW